MSRNAFFAIGISIVALIFGFAAWVGSRLGAFSGWLTLMAMIPVNIWIFDKLPGPPDKTQEEKDADALFWSALSEKLVLRVGPVALAVWLLYRWLERL